MVDDADKERFRYFKQETDADDRRRALFANPFTHSTVMLRRDVALAAGGYGNYKNAEDWDLWLNMGTRGTFYNFPGIFREVSVERSEQNGYFQAVAVQRNTRGLAIHRTGQYPNFYSAYLLNLGQYCFSLLPRFLQRALYTTLSRAKRTAFIPDQTILRLAGFCFSRSCYDVLYLDGSRVPVGPSASRSRCRRRE